MNLAQALPLRKRPSLPTKRRTPVLAGRAGVAAIHRSCWADAHQRRSAKFCNSADFAGRWLTDRHYFPVFFPGEWPRFWRPTAGPNAAFRLPAITYDGQSIRPRHNRVVRQNPKKAPLRYNRQPTFIVRRIAVGCPHFATIGVWRNGQTERAKCRRPIVVRMMICHSRFTIRACGRT